MWKFTAFASAFALVLALSSARAEETSAQPTLPPTPEPSDEPGALLVPSRTGARTEIDRTAVDVLLRTAIERFDVQLVMQEPREDACGHHDEALSQIRNAYLAMNIDDALDEAMALRASIEADFGDVFDCAALTEAELLSVQMLLDLGRAQEAEELALTLLARRPLLTLDPVEYPPQMQALWARLARGDEAATPKRPAIDRLRRLGQTHHARFVIFGRVFHQSERDILDITVVDESGPKPVRAQVPLSSSSSWMAAVRSALSKALPLAPVNPPEQEARSSRSSVDLGLPIKPPENVAEDTSRPFYKRWWFWTAVGVVVVGATAGAITAYSVANKKPSTAVEIDPWTAGGD